MAVKFLSGDEAKKEMEKGELVIVNVFATWCGPCKMFAPILEKYSNNYSVVKVDLDKDREFANSLKVTGVPTTVFFKGNKELDRIVGYAPEEAVGAKLASL